MEQRIQDFKKSEKFPEMKPKESFQIQDSGQCSAGNKMALFKLIIILSFGQLIKKKKSVMAKAFALVLKFPSLQQH